MLFRSVVLDALDLNQGGICLPGKTKPAAALRRGAAGFDLQYLVYCLLIRLTANG